MTDLESLMQYLMRPVTDYAYMITGEWGSGKTYFWKNVVLPELLEERDWNNNKPFPVYVSLYGVKEINEITELIFAQSNPHLHKLSKASGTIAKVSLSLIKNQTGFDLKEYRKEAGTTLKNLAKKLGNRSLILCVDDLERCEIQYDQIFGLLNGYVEHAGIKVVILCNESHILQKKKKRNKYLAEKEKVVRATFKFKGFVNKAITSFFDEFESNKSYRQYLEDKKQAILTIFLASKYWNLRILNYSLQILQEIFDCCLEADPESYSGWKDQLVTTVIPIAFEFQKGKLTRGEVKKFFSKGPQVPVKAILAKQKGDTYIPTNLENFQEKYKIDKHTNPIVISKAISQMITDGALNISLLSNELTTKSTRLSEERKAAMYLLENYYILNDVEFDNVIRESIEAIRIGHVPEWDLILRIVSCLSIFVEKGFLESIDSTLSAVQEYISIQMQASTFEIQNRLQIDHARRQLRSENNDATKALEMLLKANNESIKKARKAAFQFAIKNIENDPRDVHGKLSWVTEDSFYDVPLNEFADVDQFANLIASSSPKVKHLIGHAIKERYSKKNPRIHNLIVDEEWLIRFKEILDTEFDKANLKRPSGVLLKEIIENIETALTRINSLKVETKE
jgi:hypothetical protein